jgi:hypothetical protein
VAQHLELVVGNPERLLLEREGQPVDDEEADQVARGPNGKVAELQGLRRPRAEGQLPGQVEQASAAIAQPQLRKTRDGDGLRIRQSFLRRYAVTVESYPSDS